MINWQWYFPVMSGILNIVYGTLLYNIGPTASIRRRGLEYIYDTVISFIIFSIFLTIFIKLQLFIELISHSLGLKTYNVTSMSTIDVMDLCAKFFIDCFNNVKNLLLSIFLVCMTLNLIPYTVPAALYISQSTQYLQWMAHWALINLYMYYVLSNICKYSIAISGIGFGLIVPRQTRNIGSLLVSMCIVLPSQVELVYLWELNNQIKIMLPHTINISNALSVAKDIVLGGYAIAQALQEQNIIMDLASAISGAIIYALTKIIDQVGQYLKI